MEGALVPISFKPGAAPHATQAESLEIIVNTPQDQVVNPVGDGATNAEGRRIEVKPPMVGGWHAQRHQVFRAGVGPVGAPKLGKHWLADLNLNPRYRGAAGYGAEVVRKNQEDYVDACWDQIGEILAAEMKFNLTRLAIEALGALKRKHFDVLPPERLMQVFGPALPRIEAFGTAAQTFRINGQIASIGGRLDRSSMPGALVDAALRRVASPGSRALRVAARLNQSTAALPGIHDELPGNHGEGVDQAIRVCRQRLHARRHRRHTHVRRHRSRRRRQRDRRSVGKVGLQGARYTVGQVKKTVASGNVATKTLASKGVPELKIRVGQHLGVFTDLHVDRFGQLASQAPAIKASDWGVIASQVEGLGERGVEGFLVESTNATAQLQVSAMRLDARSGRLHGRPRGRPLQRLANSVAARQAAAVPRAPLAALAGTRIGQVAVGTSREFNAGGLISALPPNALTSAVGDTTPNFTLNPNLEFERREPGGAPPPVTSLTFPPALRQREVLNRFSVATQGVQATWRDAFAASRVEVQVIDFPIAQAAVIVRARTDPALTLPAAAGVDGVDCRSRARHDRASRRVVPVQERTRRLSGS